MQEKSLRITGSKRFFIVSLDYPEQTIYFGFWVRAKRQKKNAVSFLLTTF